MTTSQYLDDDDEATLAVSPSKSGIARGVFHKTADTFSGILGKRLQVVPLDNGSPRTDGSRIWVDFEAPEGYLVMEHELSHILFKSDSDARNAFVVSYSQMVQAAVRKAGVSLDERDFVKFVEYTIGILEDRRVNSLWGELYPGSSNALRKHCVSDFRASVPRHVLTYLMQLSYGVDHAKTDASITRFRAICQTAIRSVDRRAFTSTLVMTKWLVTQLVTALIVEEQERKKQEGSQHEAGSQSQGDQGDQDQDQGDQDQDQGDQDQDQGDQDQDQGDQDPSQGKGQQGQQTGVTTDQPGGGAPSRAQALADLMAGTADAVLSQQSGDYSSTGLKSRVAELQAQQMAKQALSQNIDDSATLEAALAKSEADMEKVVDTFRDKLGLSKISHDDWLRRDLNARIVFNDIAAHETYREHASPEERSAVKRLRGHFLRVLGRKTTELSDTGSEVDVRAFIDAKALGAQAPFYKAEGTGRGFEAIVLVDRSGSMAGRSHHEADKACQMLADAMNFPFVKFRVWGFKATGPGIVNIDRYATNCKTFSSLKSTSDGYTPLHVATRLALRELNSGSAVKHLFVLTDGAPSFTDLTGSFMSTQQQMQWVREAVLQGQRHGIGTTGVMLGAAVAPEHMTHMFLKPQSWKELSADRFGEDLFSLVMKSFNTYLRAR